MNISSSQLRHMVCALSLLLAVGGIASADTSVDTGTTAEPRLTRLDQRFVEKIAKLGLEEIGLSKLAAERASREEVRAFARDLAADQEKYNEKLSSLASNKGIVLPVRDDSRLEYWARKNGSDFDADYLKRMIGAHQDMIDLMESSAKKADDSDVAAFARDHLAAFHEQLRKVQELRKILD